MAGIIEFSWYGQEPDLSSMDWKGLTDCLRDVRARIGQLDSQEPEDMDSEEYEDWGERHEVLEDLADEIQDLLDEMEGRHD